MTSAYLSTTSPRFNEEPVPTQPAIEKSIWQAGVDKSRAVAEYLEFLEDLECSEWPGRTTGNTQTSPQSQLGVFAILGRLGKLKILALPPI